MRKIFLEYESGDKQSRIYLTLALVIVTLSGLMIPFFGGYFHVLSFLYYTLINIILFGLGIIFTGAVLKIGSKGSDREITSNGFKGFILNFGFCFLPFLIGNILIQVLYNVRHLVVVNSDYGSWTLADITNISQVTILSQVILFVLYVIINIAVISSFVGLFTYLLYEKHDVAIHKGVFAATFIFILAYLLSGPLISIIFDYFLPAVAG